MGCFKNFILTGQTKSLAEIKYFHHNFQLQIHQLINSATATVYVTDHDQSLSSKMTGWRVVMTVPDWSHTSKMTGLGLVCDW